MEKFKDLVESGRNERKITLEKFSIAYDVWVKASEMQDVYIHHKEAMSQQVLKLCRAMQRNKASNPSP